MPKTFQLWVQLVTWRDGDSFRGVLDQGCFTYRGRLDKPIMYRCSLIDAPELPTEEGLAALEFARRMVPAGEYACISTGLDVYGRPLLDLVTERGLFSEVMLGAGFAKPYKR